MPSRKALGTALVGAGTLAAALLVGTQPASATSPFCTVNNGVQFCQMPDLSGDSLSQARSELSSVGFQVGRVSFFVDNICNNINTVASQNPRETVSAPNLILFPQGTSVDLRIGTRPNHPCP
ncbi:PASTA domain-containing protein [Nonomuraea sp. NPDC050536]|uniref:PASTA domain-containing protein n=1 Tax=Nonomuraea sp. NPDC050536 TaxID=3364366 RepID=UPI0037C8B850